MADGVNFGYRQPGGNASLSPVGFWTDCGGHDVGPSLSGDGLGTRTPTRDAGAVTQFSLEADGHLFWKTVEQYVSRDGLDFGQLACSGGVLRYGWLVDAGTYFAPTGRLGLHGVSILGSRFMD